MFQIFFVTGGAGFIGSAIIRTLLKRRAKVINLDAMTYAANKDNIDTANLNDDYLLVEGSINDRALVSKLLAEHQPQAVINVAAETHVDRSIDGPGPFVETNIQGTFQLLEACRSYVQGNKGHEDFRYLQVSTDEVFGSIDNGQSVETDPYRPNSPYAASKAAADHLVRSYFKTYGLATITTHGSNTYGPYQFPEKLLPLMVLNAVDGKQLPVYGDGSNERDWLYVDDHANGILAALESGVVGNAYNIGGGTELKNIDIVNLLCSILDKLQPREDGAPYADQINYVADRPGHDQRYALDCKKAKRDIGWSPQMDFTTGLEETIKWYLNHQDWCSKIATSTYDRSRLGLDVGTKELG